MPSQSYALTQLKPLREWRHLTQAQLADLSGVKLTTIQKHERGVQRSAALDVAAPLARALQVSIDALYDASISNKLLQKNAAPLLRMASPQETPHEE
ncbi:helix-turn-helix transcriptional regulator [Deinococcus sp. KSM4-11]|uniref:helix-turn-helix transcriptional regulator n=1 Tax=Deinococcus sp. KSM4-11 TaxID=2568654 RepID=UPI0010A3F0FA|nr:helix-turn-helix transcriptional regulator [Deinococcus sp. KSM4-11]THF88490.1 helix-turn-helix transcriptional regulator [Deinococcus sp. KSM4-11]